MKNCYKFPGFLVDNAGIFLGRCSRHYTFIKEMQKGVKIEHVSIIKRIATNYSIK
jgi:hypothetical protein